MSRGSPRARRDSRHSPPRESWWLDEYALFRSLHVAHDERAWTSGRSRSPRAEAAALLEARSVVDAEIEISLVPPMDRRRAMGRGEADGRGRSRVFGDLPFMISANSPDVWARQDEFRFDATIGVPPDAFSESGQDWGLPPWRADVMARARFTWMRARARRYGALYDGFRIDHLVGLYRMYVRPIDKSNAGILRSRRGTGADRARRNADRDLRRRRGTAGSDRRRSGIGPAVRARVDGAPGPARAEGAAMGATLGSRRANRRSIRRSFPERSVATTGTHDIEPLAATPKGQPKSQRRRLCSRCCLRART